MNEGKKLLKNTGLIAMGDFGTKVLSFLLLPLYTSILSTEEYGIFDFIVAVSAFLIPVVSVQMNEAMFRFIIQDVERPNEFYKNVSVAAFIEMVGILVLGLCMAFVSMFYDPEICLYIWLYVGCYSFFIFGTFLLRAQGNNAFCAAISLVKGTLQLVLNVLSIAVFRWGFRGLLFSMFVSEAIAFAAIVIYSKLWKQIKWRFFEKLRAKEMLKYSLPLIPNALCGQIINLSDRIIISSFLGAGANGIYAVSYKFPNIIETVYHYFYLAWSESASRVIEKGKDYARSYYQSLHDVLDNLVFSVVLCMISGMPILFRLFIKGDYLSGFDYIPLLMLAMYFGSMGRFYSGIYTALKKTTTLATSTMIGAAISIGLNLVMISWLGLYAAALSNLLAQAVVLLVRKVRLKKDVDILVNWKSVVSKLVMAMLVILLYSYDNWLMTGASIMCAAAYSLYTNRSILGKLVTKLVRIRK